MPGMAIIGENAYGALNPAPPSDLGAIYDALGGQADGSTDQMPARTWINGAGEALVPAFQPWTPALVAGAIQAGQIWVDYCGWPMYQQVTAAGAITPLGPSGWQTFVEALGYPWLSYVQFSTGFQVPGTSSFAYPFVRGYQVRGSQNGVYLPQGSITFPSGLLGIGGGSAPLQVSGYAVMMGLHPPGGGYYFYGVYTNAEQQAAGGQVPGYGQVPPDLYAAFILAVVNGQSSFASGHGSGIITHLAYQIPQTTSSGGSPPVNPYPTGTGNGTGGSPTVGVPSTSGTGAPSVEVWVGIGSAAAGLGLLGWWWWERRRQG